MGGLYCAVYNGAEAGVLVQRVVMPDAPVESWTVVGADYVPIEAAESFLAHLSSIGRSPNTVRAYAHDLRDYFAYLAGRDLDWRRVRLEDLGGFISWLRLPAAARSGAVTVLPVVEAQCSERTINRKLSALVSFYRHHERHGVDVSGLLTGWGQSGRQRATSWRPMLAHVKGEQRRRRPEVKVKAVAALPHVLAAGQVQAILDGCVRLRDRLLFALLFDTGVRIGEALGLRHADLASADRELTVTARLNANGARAKSWRRTVPVSSELVRLYADYLHNEYGDLDSDYVFVNLWGQPLGHAMSYGSVHDLVQRLRQKTGVAFTPHQFRHTYATDLLRRKTPVEVVANLLGHASIATTVDTYGHLTFEDARRVMDEAGYFDGRGVRL